MKRARSTRSWPWRMMPCGSPSVFSTARKCGSSLPCASSTAKYFWWSRITVTRHFFRQLEKFRFKASQDYRRKFREVHDCVEQRFIFPPARSGNGARGGIERFANLMFALLHGPRPWPAKRFDVGRAGLGICDCADPPIIRCPREVFPARTPSNSSGITCPSSIATSQRTGRTNFSPGLRQYMFLGQ